MKRAFTRRECVVLVILALFLLAVGYYMFIDLPVRTRVLEAESRQSAAQTELDIETVQLIRMREMQAALDTLHGSETILVPDYDNSRNVMLLLNRALSSTTSYNLSFHSIVFTDSIASRAIDMTFTAASYADAKALVRALDNSGYRCEISALSLSGASGSGHLLTGNISGVLTVTFFEYVP